MIAWNVLKVDGAYTWEMETGVVKVDLLQCIYIVRSLVSDSKKVFEAKMKYYSIIHSKLSTLALL